MNIKHLRSLITILLVVTLIPAVARATSVPNCVDFHAKWFGGAWTIHKNTHGYDAPVWQANHLDLKMDNIAIPDWSKEVWVEVNWATGKPGSAPDLDLTQPGSGARELVTAPTKNGDGYTWHWHINPQPAEEWIKFPDTGYFDLQNISSVEVGTYCATKTIHKPNVLYGDLQGVKDQYDCGPTSATNSFAYLERAFPHIYGRKLIPDIPDKQDYGTEELRAVAKILADPKYIGCNALSGKFIKGKEKYINEKAPGTTIFGAQSAFRWKPEWGEKPDWVETEKVPTSDWLYEQLLSCEDVEIGFEPITTQAGHWVTLTSFSWIDDQEEGEEGHGRIDKGEAKIDYIDPYDGKWHESEIWFDINKKRLETNWNENGHDYWISVGVKESPIPEPLTMLGVFLGVCGLGRYVRRRRLA